MTVVMTGLLLIEIVEAKVGERVTLPMMVMAFVTIQTVVVMIV